MYGDSRMDSTVLLNLRSTVDFLFYSNGPNLEDPRKPPTEWIGAGQKGLLAKHSVGTLAQLCFVRPF